MRDEAMRYLTSDFISIASKDQQYAWHVAAAYTMLGDFDDAVDWLEKAVARGFVNYPMLAEYDPLLRDLRGFARFDELVSTVKVKWDNFEA